jgi:signal peptide peptidase SppA
VSKLARVVASVYERPWFIREDKLLEISAIVDMHVRGGGSSLEAMRSAVQAAEAANGPRRGQRTVGAIAVIPIYGAIFPRANLMTEFSGGATVSGIRAAFREAMTDEAVGSILLDVDSPGGYVDGVDELATEIREARGQGKPIVAIADYTMASAAYYIASAADEIVASPSAMVGWIGTVLVHQEFSKADELEGVTTTVIRNPARKYEVNTVEPLTEAAEAQLQEEVDDYTGSFHAAVAKGRGVSVATVKANFGQGTGMSAQRAKAAGLVDRVEPIDATIRRLATGKGPGSRGAAARIENLGPDGQILTPEQAMASLAQPLETDGDNIDGTTEPPPPDRSNEAEAALALARAQAR